MKALIVTPYYFPTIGGLENYARQLNAALKLHASWEIVIVTSHAGRSVIKETVDGNQIYRLGTLFKLSNTPFNPAWPLQMRRIIRSERPDVIIAHSPVPSLADAVSLVRGRTPFIVVYHATTLLKAGSPLFNMAARLYGLMGARTLVRADRIFAVSDYVREHLPAAQQAKAVVVPNAVWSHEIVARKQPAEPRFIFIASLAKSHAWKGLSQILEAVAAYRRRYGAPVFLTAMGDGDMRGAYEAQARDLGIEDAVTFVGAKVGADKDHLINEAMGMLVYPTTENDAFPTVMLEAWARAVPVISARIGALTSLVRDGLDGLICEAKNPEKLAEAMHALVAMPAAQRADIARNAAERTRNHYTWEIQAAQVQHETEALL
ncbi:MAG TPA: glycosyltransferase family 4 protein [Candidatus Saccharimonadales bacterium]|nr:glycosyltransferase family 4 protein [Candidatus Saccharimonadales bacterium]